jgi:hypothetical protein
MNMEANAGTNTDLPCPEDDGSTEDLLVIARWVRKELFVKVKFLYDIEQDLRIDGPIYNMFVTDCKGRLIGLSKLSNAAIGSPSRTRYVQSLWKKATGKKKNFVGEGLSQRRSSIYSATQNRFNGEFLNDCAHLIFTIFSL